MLFRSRAGVHAGNQNEAARVLAYCSIAGYEGIRHGNEQFKSLDGKLNGLAGLPQPDPGKGYHWGLVGSFAQKQVAFYLFSNATIETRQSLISLAQEPRSQLLNQGVSSEPIGNSILYGENLGNALIQWIMTDNFIQADRLKQVCVDYWLPIWIYNAAFKILKSDVKPIFCFVRPEFFITDLYDLDDDDDILTYSEITESEWMELLTKTKKL